MRNRTQAPPIQKISKINFPSVQKINLSNGIPVFLIADNAQEVVRAEFVFKAGKWFEEENLLADFTNQLMREGAAQKSSAVIAEEIDYWGASLESSVSFDTASFQVYSLSKNLPPILPIVKEIFTQADFPEAELETLIANKKEKLKERLAKTEHLANRIFLPNMWGAQHPYGRITLMENFEQISTPKIISFYQAHYTPTNAFIILAGNITDSLLKEIDLQFGDKNWVGNEIKNKEHWVNPTTNKKVYEEKTDAVQSTVLVGNKSINKFHADYAKFTVMNTLFGGYFGSRLMENIREDKGYTYGIYSSLSSYLHGGIFEVSAEVGKEVYKKTLIEIENEMKRMQDELVGADELDIVQNYMAGRVLRSVDGALKFADTFRGLLFYEQTPDYINEYLKTIYETTPAEIQQLAQKYLNYNDMYEVVVG